VLPTDSFRGVQERPVPCRLLECWSSIRRLLFHDENSRPDTWRSTSTRGILGTTSVQLSERKSGSLIPNRLRKKGCCDLETSPSFAILGLGEELWLDLVAGPEDVFRSTRTAFDLGLRCLNRQIPHAD
jgi:hypothetical protein